MTAARADFQLLKRTETASQKTGPKLNIQNPDARDAWGPDRMSLLEPFGSVNFLA